MKSYQKCRVCGVSVPAGFTNCDDCYHKIDTAKTSETKKDLIFTAGFQPWKTKISTCS